MNGSGILHSHKNRRKSKFQSFDVALREENIAELSLFHREPALIRQEANANKKAPTRFRRPRLLFVISYLLIFRMNELLHYGVS